MIGPGLSNPRRVPVRLAALIDKNGDGVIDYQEFLPVCFSMIVEILSDKVCGRAVGCFNAEYVVLLATPTSKHGCVFHWSVGSTGEGIVINSTSQKTCSRVQSIRPSAASLQVLRPRVESCRGVRT